MSLLARSLKHRVEVLAPKEGDQWSSVGMFFAHVDNINHNKFTLVDPSNFGSVLAQTYMVFTFRFTHKVVEGMRIKYSGSIFEIKRVSNVRQAGRLIEAIGLKINI